MILAVKCLHESCQQFTYNVLLLLTAIYTKTETTVAVTCAREVCVSLVGFQLVE